MKRAAFTERDTAAGALKAARGHAFVSAMGWDLPDWPAPAAASYGAFMHQRRKLADADDILLGDEALSQQRLRGVLDKAAACDQLELWFGASFAEQIALCLIVNEIGAMDGLPEKTALASIEVRLGEQGPDWVRGYPLELSTLDTPARELAAATWSAFCAPTPEPWLALMQQDTSALLQLKAAGLRWLEELPDTLSGLSRTERDWLEQIAGHPTTLMKSFGTLMAFRQPVLGYWRLGQVLVDMLNADEPLIAGAATSAFDLALHDDRARHEAFCSATLRLTSFGEALLAGEADHVARNGINRWWGGTHLTRASPWRWNATERRVVI